MSRLRRGAVRSQSLVFCERETNSAIIFFGSFFEVFFLKEEKEVPDSRHLVSDGTSL